MLYEDKTLAAENRSIDVQVLYVTRCHDHCLINSIVVDFVVIIVVEELMDNVH